MKRIIVITGQTATGKTALALKYAEKFKGELVNCDSRQIYKHLDIITGKDLEKNSKFKIQNSKLNSDIGYYYISGTKLWLYDIVDPKDYFSSFDYVQCTIPVIKDILSRGKTPIVIGGTGFYLKHLLYDFPTNIPPNWKLRRRLEKKSLQELQTIYQQLNNRTMKQLNNSDLNNPRRLIRRIEILSSISPSQQSCQPPVLKTLLQQSKLHVKMIGLKYRNKKNLISAVAKRVEKRLKQGAINEVKNLLKKGYQESDPGLKTIGYQQIIHCLQGKLTQKEATDQWINKEVQYAKRQLTFLKKIDNIDWIEL